MSGLASKFDSDVVCPCGHLQRHHVAGELRCPVLDVATGEKCACEAFREPCGQRSLRHPDLTCELSPGHDGAHMHFATAGITAWGWRP